MFTVIACAVVAALAYLAGEQTAYRSCGYGSEPAYTSLSPYWLRKAWFRR